MTTRTSQSARTALAFLLLACFALSTSADQRSFIDWAKLRNPVLEYPNWSVKDAAMAQRAGVFYLFFGAFYEDGGRMRSHVVTVSTRDFKTWSEPLFNFTAADEGPIQWIGMASPNVTEDGGIYYLTFNSWGDKPGAPNQLFYMTSRDLRRWLPRRPLAANLTKGTRAIDAAVAFANGRCYLIWKEEQKTRIAAASRIDGAFTLVGDGSPKFTKSDGADAPWHENYQFIKIDGQWRLLGTGVGHQPFLYRLRQDGARDVDWLAWADGYQLKVAQEQFNTDNQANAAALYDWRHADGYFYLLYAGRTEGESYARRGWNRLALSRSKDLIHWLPAGSLEGK